MKKIVSLNLPRNINSTYIGSKNEIIIDNTNVYIHDGSTIGGTALLLENMNSGNNSNSVTINLSGDVIGNASGNTLNISTTLALVGTPGTYNNIITDSKGRIISGFLSNYITSNSVTINLSGDVIGNASGNTLNVTTSLISVGASGTYNSVVTDSKGRVISGTGLISNTIVLGQGSIGVNGSNSSNAVTVLSLVLPISGIYGITYIVRGSTNASGYGIASGLYINGNTTSSSITGGTLLTNSEVLSTYGVSTIMTATGYYIYSANSANTAICLGVWGVGTTSGVYAQTDNNYGRTSLTYVKIG